MKLLGMIGGTGPESTIDYYRLLIKIYRELKPDAGQLPVVINSVDGIKLMDLINSFDLPGTVSLLLMELQRMEKAGVTLGILTSNMLHLVFDDLQLVSPIPLISIVDTTCQAAQAMNLKRIGLIGTRPTMQGGFYQKAFEQAGMELVTPDTAEQDYLHTKYFSELVKGIFLAETRDRFVDIAEQLKLTKGIEGLVLGGTEIPLLLREVSDMTIPLLDTTRLHVERVVRELL
jgi:aspartate racemase